MGKLKYELIQDMLTVRNELRNLARDMNLDLYFKQGGEPDKVCCVIIRNDEYYNIICDLNKITDINKAIESVKEYIGTFPGRDLAGSFIVENKDKSSIYPSMMNVYDMDICSLYPTDYVMVGKCLHENIEHQLRFKIKKVIFNDPATIVIWADGSKTVVKCQPGDTFDKEKGLAMAISKRALGDKGRYCEEFKKWIPEIEEEVKVINSEEIVGPYSDAMMAMKNFEETLKNYHVTIPELKIEYPKNLFGLKNVKE